MNNPKKQFDTDRIASDKVIIAESFNVQGDFHFGSLKSSRPEITSSVAKPTLILGSYIPDADQDQLLSGRFPMKNFDTQPSLYRYKLDDGRLIIQPSVPYLDTVRNGGEIVPFSPWHLPWEKTFSFPALDVKLVNNSDKTIFFHEALLNVQSSRLDPRPIPIISGKGYFMKLPLRNIGWGPMEDCMLRFTLEPNDNPVKGDRQARNPSYPFELQIGTVDEETDYPSLEPYFSRCGVHVENLKELSEDTGGFQGLLGNWVFLNKNGKLGEFFDDSDSLIKGCRRMPVSEYNALLKEAYGPFQSGVGFVYGEIEYSQTDTEAKKSRLTNKFSAVVTMGRLPYGAPQQPSYSYHVSLKAEGDNYTRTVPISHSLAAGESDRFLIFVAADKSSLHDFDFVLRYNETECLAPRDVTMEIFLSRPDAAHLNEEALILTEKGV